MNKYIFTAGLMLAIFASTFLVAGAQDKEPPPPEKNTSKVVEDKKSKDAPSVGDKAMKVKVITDKDGTVTEITVGGSGGKKKKDENYLSDAEIERLLEMAKDKGPLGAAAREQLRNALGVIDRMALLPTDEPYQDFIYLDDSRPVLVRVHSQVAGKPVGAAWNDFVTDLFRTGDTDKDGFLNQKEFERIPSLDQILSGGPSVFGGFRGMNSPMNFASLDTNGDGKISLAEFAAYLRNNGFAPFQVEPPRDENQGMRFGFGMVDKEPSIEAVGDAIFKLLDTNRDGKITREELAAAYDVLRSMDTNEDEMLTTREIAPDARGNSGKGAMMGGMMGRSGPRSGNGNGNGKIILLRNGEVVNGAERTLNNFATPYGMAMKSSPSDEVAWENARVSGVEKKETGISEVARRLQERYSRKGKAEPTFLGDMIDNGLRSMRLAKVETAADKAKDLLLSRADIGLDEATFAFLDTNKDGRLDAKELALFGKRTPDVELVVRLGSRTSGQDKVEVLAAKALEFWPSITRNTYLQAIVPYDGPNDKYLQDYFDLADDREAPLEIKKTPPPIKVAPPKNDKVVVSVKKKQERLNVSGQREFAMIDLGKTRTELRSKDSPKTDSMASLSRQQSAAQFKNADREGKGYLEEKDAQNFGFGGAMFKAMDRDGDGKVTEKEFYAYLDMMAELQKKARQACVTLVLSDESRGLFTLMDTNRDGKLSVRELREAIKLLESLDRTGKGYVTRADVPKMIRLTVRQGAASNGEDGYGSQIAAIYGISVTDEEEVPAAGPAWFRKMDRNRDGDVSLSEWLGSEDLFRRIDTNGDGLISVQEAEAYDASQRQKK